MFKKIISLLLSLVVVLTTFFVVPFSVSALIYDDLEYTISDGTATITGYKGAKTEVIIPNTLDGATVTQVASNAFKEVKQLKSITLPDSVKYIGEYAFSGCTALEYINYPASLESAGSEYYPMFYQCPSLKSITVPEGVTVLPRNVFKESSLEQINLPSTLKTIGKCAFSENKEIKSITLPDSVDHIGEYAFSNCTSLEYINYPVSLESAGSWSGPIFYMCSNLKEITVPEGITSLPDNVFKDSSLEEINLPSTLKTIGSRAFAENSKIKSITLPDSVDHIGEYAFSHCVSLEYVNYPASLESAGSEYYPMFYQCPSLKSITVPEGVTLLPYAVFKESSLEQINLPSTLKTIGSRAFAENNKIKSITLPDSVDRIGEYAFSGCTALEYINYPASLESAGSEYYPMFYQCPSLKSITVPEGITSLPDNVFKDSSLEDINLPSTLKTIGSRAFAENNKIKSITLPNSVDHIGEYAFSGCTALEYINYPTSLESAGSEYYPMFYQCPSLKSITVPEGVTVLPRNVFKESSLEQINLPSTLKTIGKCAFSENKEIKSITLPNSVDHIGEYAFSNCTSLEYINYPDSLESVGSYAFSGCSLLTVYCDRISKGLLKFIADLDVCFKLNSNEFAEESIVLNRDKSSYSTNFTSYSGTGGVPLICEYSIDDFSNIENQKLLIRIPKNSILLENTIKVDGVLCTDYSLTNKYLSIPVKKADGRVTFTVKPDENYSGVISYAVLEFSVSDMSDTQIDIIGVICEEIPAITLSTSSIINTNNINFTGISVADCVVDIYIDGVWATEVQANKAGIYSGNISISNIEENKQYELKAVRRDKDNVFAIKRITYSETTPVLTGFNLVYNGIDYDLTKDKKHNVTFASQCEYSFNLEFDNPESLNEVYVVSTRSNVNKYLKAEWNQEENAYVTKGCFDENDRSYVPGLISVQYNTPREDSFSVSQIEQKYYDILQDNPDLFSDVVVTQNNLSDNEIEYTINTGESASLGDLGVDMYKMVVKETSKANEIDWFGYASSVNDFYTYFFDEGNEKYYLNLDYSDPKEWVMIIDDIGSNKLVEVTFEAIGDKISSPLLGTSFDTFTGALGCFGMIKDAMDITDDYDDLVDRINSSGLSAEERETALKKAKELKKDREAYLLMTTLITVATAGSGGLPFALLMGSMNTLSDFFFEYRMAGIFSSDYSVSINWAIDPSGVVYDKFTNKELPGVKTTVYCIPYDGSGEDFWTTPDTDKAVLWDASEYSQNNPIYTDNNGYYSWDVPEGWWQVKYEKEGYITTYSEWLPVPPPQTNVNIWMKPILVLKSISISEVPTELSYQDGNLTVTGGKITLVYDNGLTETIQMTPEMLTDYDVTVQEKQTVTVEYDGFKATFETEIRTIGEEVMDSEVKGASISLGGNIAVNFHMTLSEAILADANARVVFTLPGGTKQTVYVKNAEVSDNGYYVFTCEVNAIQMASTIKAQVIATDYKSEEFSYSVVEYAEYLLREAENGNAEYIESAPLVKAMLNYGANSQQYFGYGTENLANNILAEEDKVLETVDFKSYASLVKGAEAGVRYYGSSLTLKSETVINLYFAIEDEENIPEFYVNGVATTPAKVDNLYKIRIEDIPAQNLDNKVVVTVGGLTVEYSAFSYCNTAMSLKDEKLNNIFKALYAYNQAAEGYLNTKS